MKQSRHLDMARGAYGARALRLLTVLLATLAALGAAACSGIDTFGADDEDLSQLSTYRSEMKMVSYVYTSNLAPNPQIELWINQGAAAAYKKVHPDRKGANVDLPEGTLIVREVFEAGKVAKLTVMGKGAPGSNPVVGDWWFGVTTPTGTPLWENGQELLGKLPQCVNCHDDRGAADDFLFGVPTTSQQL
jgi:hypothetical protein